MLSLSYGRPRPQHYSHLIKAKNIAGDEASTYIVTHHLDQLIVPNTTVPNTTVQYDAHQFY